MRARHHATKTKTPRTKSEKIEISSGNVFADLGFEDSEERLSKAKLASKIATLTEQKGVDPSSNGLPHTSRIRVREMRAVSGNCPSSGSVEDLSKSK